MSTDWAKCAIAIFAKNIYNIDVKSDKKLIIRQKEDCFVEKLGYSQKEAAEALGVCRQTIAKMIQTGKIIAKRPSPGRVIISASSLREYMNEHE